MDVQAGFLNTIVVNTIFPLIIHYQYGSNALLQLKTPPCTGIRFYYQDHLEAGSLLDSRNQNHVHII